MPPGNLTVNFGLRYEFSSVLQEQHNLLGDFRSQLGPWIGAGENRQRSDPKPLQSRSQELRTALRIFIGFLGKGKTVIRGGAGLVYETVNWQSFVAFNNAFGPGSVPTGLASLPGGTITTGNVTTKNFLSFSNPGETWDNTPVNNATINCNASPCPIMSVDRNLTTPYVWNWSLSVTSFTPNLTLEVAYVGNHGANQTGIRDINQPP